MAGGFPVMYTYAKTREECEEKLAVMIEEMKMEIASEKAALAEIK